MIPMCQKCGQRPGTECWCADTLALVHGMSAMWCKRCVLETQLEHARESAASIPELETALAKERTR